MLRLDFVVTGAGVAEIHLADGRDSLVIGVGDDTDPLGDLGEAFVRLGTGDDVAELVCFGDGLEHRLQLERIGHDGLRLDVTRSEGYASLDPGRLERLVFHGAGSLSACALDIVDSIGRIARSYGIAGYEAMWEPHAFPRRSRDALLRRFESSRSP